MSAAPFIQYTTTSRAAPVSQVVYACHLNQCSGRGGVAREDLAAENVAAAARWSERPGGTPAELLALVEMGEQATVTARRLTGGRRKLLELAMALAGAPTIEAITRDLVDT